MMEYLMKMVGAFAVKDVPYIIGGVSIILALSYFFGVSIPENISVLSAIVIFGIAHPLGYAAQEAVSLTPLMKTASLIKANRVLKAIYRYWHGTVWIVPDDFDAQRAYYRLYRMPFEISAPVQRLIFLIHLCSTIGASWLVCAFILLLEWLGSRQPRSLILAMMVLIASSVLIFSGWLQRMEFNIALYRMDKGDFDDQSLTVD